MGGSLPLYNLDTKRDFWDLRPLTHLIRALTESDWDNEDNNRKAHNNDNNDNNNDNNEANNNRDHNNEDNNIKDNDDNVMTKKNNFMISGQFGIHASSYPPPPSHRDLTTYPIPAATATAATRHKNRHMAIYRDTSVVS